jgi:hypothetical protein
MDDHYDDEDYDEDDIWYRVCPHQDCIVPGEHYRSECHTAEEMQSYYAALAGLDHTPSAETCAWTPDTSYDGVWESECGVLYQFMADGPLENGFAFCHSCGRPLVVRLDDSPSP